MGGIGFFGRFRAVAIGGVERVGADVGAVVSTCMQGVERIGADVGAVVSTCMQGVERVGADLLIAR